MSNDWAKKYIRIYEEKQQEKRAMREMAELARATAPDVFQRIKSRVRHDLQTLHEAGVLQSLSFNDISTQSFAVTDMAPAVVSCRSSLVVEFDIIVVKYRHLFPQKKGETTVCESVGALRIYSDLSGVSTMYRSGSSEGFADESEVSEFLLRPLLDYVDS